MEVLVVIVNYRTPKLVCDALRSLAADGLAERGGKAIVVDNASGDDSVATLERTIAEQGWSAWASVQPLATNGGFAAGNNAAIREVLAGDDPPRFVWLLNPDTIVRAGALAAMVDFMADHDRVGIVGSQLLDEREQVAPSARRCPSPWSEFEGSVRLGVVSRWLHRRLVRMPVKQQPHECDWVSGASMLVRREVFDDVGLLDEGYFLYFEELDFCIRAGLRGWEVWHVPASRIVHLEGSSTGIGQRKRRGGYWYDSRRRFFVKRYGIAGLVLTDLLWAVGRAGYRLHMLLRLRMRRSGDPRLFAWDLLGGDLRALVNGSAWRLPRMGRER